MEAQRNPPERTRTWPAATPLLALMLGAVVVRILTTALLPNVIWPDETFQSTEQALRVITGRGMTPWEFQIGARSWLLPGLAAPFVAAGRALSSDPRAVYALVAGLMIAISAANVASAWRIGAQVGRWHAVFAAALVAFWSELVCYSPHLLADTVSGALLLGALALATRPDRTAALVWTGVLLGAAFVLRVQLAPAIGLAGLLICGKDLRRRLPLLGVGFALPVAALGGLDWLTWGAPFRSVLVYLRANTSGIAEMFGAAPPLAYVGEEKLVWGLAAPLVLATAVLGARRAPVPAVVAVTVVATFSLVAHKEQRFIYPALLLLFTVCGVGACELAQDVAARIRNPSLRRAVLPGLALLWAAASVATAVGPELRNVWRHNAEMLDAFTTVNADPASCGVGLDQLPWSNTGLSRLRGDLELYDAASQPASAYNRLLRPAGRLIEIEGAQAFRLKRCFGTGSGVCLYRRPGACTGAAAPLTAQTPLKVRTALSGLGFTVD